MMGLKGRTVVSRIGGSPLRRSPAAAVLRRMMRADHSARPEDGTTVGKTLHRIVEKTLPDEIERAGFAFVADCRRDPERRISRKRAPPLRDVAGLPPPLAQRLAARRVNAAEPRRSSTAGGASRQHYAYTEIRRPSGASVRSRQSVSKEGWVFVAGLDWRGSTVSERIPSLQPALARRSALNAPQQAAGKQRADEAYAPRARIHDRHIRPGPGRILVGNS
jgi:hypothetical protein